MGNEDSQEAQYKALLTGLLLGRDACDLAAEHRM